MRAPYSYRDDPAVPAFPDDRPIRRDVCMLSEVGHEGRFLA